MLLPLKLKPIEDVISKALSQVILPDPGLLHFLDSTFGVTNAADLKALKSAGCEDDVDLFLDLATSPDTDVREHLEPLIWKETLTDEHRRLMSEAVSKTISSISFQMPGTTESVSFDLSVEKINRYIEKLHLEYSIPPSLLSVMDLALSLGTKVGVCLRLRHVRLYLKNEAEEFMIRFIGESACFGDSFLEYLDLSLSILTGSRSGTTIKDALTSRLEVQKKTLNQIIEAQDMMKKNSMEALMLQGFRIPPAARDTVEKEIFMLNRILACVFGWICQESEPVIHSHLGNHDSVTSVEKIIRLLS